MFYVLDISLSVPFILYRKREIICELVRYLIICKFERKINKKTGDQTCSSDRQYQVLLT